MRTEIFFVASTDSYRVLPSFQRQSLFYLVFLKGRYRKYRLEFDQIPLGSWVRYFIGEISNLLHKKNGENFDIQLFNDKL